MVKLLIYGNMIFAIYTMPLESIHPPVMISPFAVIDYGVLAV